MSKYQNLEIWPLDLLGPSGKAVVRISKNHHLAFAHNLTLWSILDSLDIWSKPDSTTINLWSNHTTLCKSGKISKKSSPLSVESGGRLTINLANFDRKDNTLRFFFPWSICPVLFVFFLIHIHLDLKAKVRLNLLQYIRDMGLFLCKNTGECLFVLHRKTN